MKKLVKKVADYGYGKATLYGAEFTPAPPDKANGNSCAGGKSNTATNCVGGKSNSGMFCG